MPPAKPRILLTGSNGQLGWELKQILSMQCDVHAYDRSNLDLTNSQQIRQRVREIKPDIIINAAAYTAVDKAEQETELAFAVNAAAPAVLAEEAVRLDAALIHYSTDYVFDGSGDLPWSEKDTPAPLNVYGKSKLAGEEAIAAITPHHLILRTSWVYGPHGNNFVKTILRIGAEKKEMNIVADQIGAPTSTQTIADATAHIINTFNSGLKEELAKTGGTYHLCCDDETSWHGFATEIAHLSKQNNNSLVLEKINPVATSEYPIPAQRPLNSRLDCSQLKETFGLQLPSWQAALARAFSQFISTTP